MDFSRPAHRSGNVSFRRSTGFRVTYERLKNPRAVLVRERSLTLHNSAMQSQKDDDDEFLDCFEEFEDEANLLTGVQASSSQYQLHRAAFYGDLTALLHSLADCSMEQLTELDKQGHSVRLMWQGGTPLGVGGRRRPSPTSNTPRYHPPWPAARSCSAEGAPAVRCGSARGGSTRGPEELQGLGSPVHGVRGVRSHSLVGRRECKSLLLSLGSHSSFPASQPSSPPCRFDRSATVAWPCRPRAAPHHTHTASPHPPHPPPPRPPAPGGGPPTNQ